MYKNNFVAIVKCDGKILRERQNNIVYLPFESEYSLSLKNLEDRNASVDITIDGKSVFGDCSFILGPGKECEIERFVENLNSGNRFRFIKKTSQITQHRGDKLDDGLICVQFTFEKQREESIEYVIERRTHYHDCFPPMPLQIPACSGLCWNCHRSYCPWKPNTYYYSSSMHPDFSNNNSPKLRATTCNSSTINSSNSINESRGLISPSDLNSVSINHVQVEPSPDEGLTVKGSISNQTFQTGYIGTLEDTTHTITFQLKGCIEKIEIDKPITTREKLICPTCGTASPSNANYCKSCGTYLIA